jgi:exodeoxyribonuclease-5
LHYNKEIQSIELDEVMRQEEKSGILFNATQLRELLKSHFVDTFQLRLKGFKDVVRLTDGFDIQDAIESAYSNYSIEDTCLLFVLIREPINIINRSG